MGYKPVDAKYSSGLDGWDDPGRLDQPVTPAAKN
jgi:hypothetical protein